MNIKQIEENINKLIADFQSGAVKQDDFIYEMMLAYGHRKSSVTRVRSGERNLATADGEIHFKRHLYFKHSITDSLHVDIDRMKKERLVERDKIRFVIASDYEQFLAIDTKTSDSLDIKLSDLSKHFDFFLPWANMEKAVYQGENPADVKAAEKMAKLFDLIRSDNFDDTNSDDIQALHNLNVFLTRLLFCFFAEDTEIFSINQFSHAIESHTKANGSDVDGYLNRLFDILNTEENKRHSLPDYLNKFPFVNGGLFADDIPSPKFSTKSRKILIECGSELDWSDINPDIFGSMIQAVVHPDQRGGMGMHYTSVTNIMKVIEPLFLNDLYEEFEKFDNNPKKLWLLLQRIGCIKIFDPACGSGNFLIIAYKELRKLEMEILKRIQELEYEKTGQQIQPFSEIKLSQFYGIELDDFAHEVATLSLWLAEHQMNVEFKVEFGNCSPTLPLHKGGNIVCENATRANWEEICPNEDVEVFVLGNPPYLGFNAQKEHHVKDIKFVFNDRKNHKYIDYIACWFFKAARYSNDLTSFAFVSTNSICQGTQVPLLWPQMFVLGLEIDFAVEEFYWSNNAKNKAAVICIIVGLSKNKKRKKYLYTSNLKREVKFINAYLADGSDVIVEKRQIPLSNISKMSTGNVPYDGGNLILSAHEKDELLISYPEAKKYILKNFGSSEYINGINRYCIWIKDNEVTEALKIDGIKERVDRVRESRKKGGKIARNYSHLPHRFYMTNRAREHQLIIPRVSSMRREYIPMGYLDSDTIISDAAQAVYDPEPHIFGILVSKIHMAWVKKFAGRLKSDFRYSAVICYNTFPIPDLSDEQKALIQESSFDILETREQFPDLSLAKLYDPNLMPYELVTAHQNNDKIVESMYTDKILENDLERVELLLALYKKMTGGQDA